MTAIAKREILSYFTSPLGYVFLAVFYAFSGLFLWMSCLSIGSASMQGVFVLMFFVVMIIVPLLTMRVFADERRQKIDQLTMTSPVSVFGIVAGKFLAAFFVFFCAALMLLIYALAISASVAAGAEFAWAQFWGNFMGMLLMGAVFISIGEFISSLTENQMIAAVGSIGANILICMFDVLENYASDETLRGIIESLSVFGKFAELSEGIFDVKNLIFFFSIIAVFNFLTIRVIERRRRA